MVGWVANRGVLVLGIDAAEQMRASGPGLFSTQTNRDTIPLAGKGSRWT